MTFSRLEEGSKEDCEKRILFANSKAAEWCRTFKMNKHVDYSGQWERVSDGAPVYIKSPKTYCEEASRDAIKIIEDCEKNLFKK